MAMGPLTLAQASSAAGSSITSFYDATTSLLEVFFLLNVSDAYGMFTSPCSLLLVHFSLLISLSGALCGPQLRRDVDIANDRARGGQWLGLFRHAGEGES